LRGKRKRDEHGASRFEIRVMLREERKGKEREGRRRYSYTADEAEREEEGKERETHRKETEWIRS
jgi:hypothetical protein